MISFSEFQNLELKVGRVIEAGRVEGSEKLLRLMVDLGEKDAADLPLNRQILAGIGKTYEPEALIGKEIVVVANLEHRRLMGLESQGMLLAASDEAGPALLVPERSVEPGERVR